MKYLKTIITLAFISLIVQGANAVAADPAGLWLASKKQDVVIKIEHCENDNLCGKIHWISDDKNPETFCEEDVLWGFEQSKDDQNIWQSGTIYRPNKDMHLGGQITLTGANTLDLWGYIGLPAFGKNYEFERVNAKSYANCAAKDQRMSQIN